MDGSLLSDLRSPDVFESPAIFSISGLELSDKFLHVFYHLSPARSLIFPVCQSNPTVSCCEVPLNQSSKISHPLPLVLSHNVFWGGFLPLFSLLSCSSIPSVCFSSTSRVSPQSHVSLMYPHFISHLGVVSLIPLIKFSRGLSAPEKRLKI